MDTTSTLELSPTRDNRVEDLFRKVSPAKRERRETERLLVYWKQMAEQLGHAPTLMSLDLSEMGTDDWAYRFIISINAVVENSGLLIYGSKFARLLDLPATPDPHVPMIEQLPQRFAPLFVKGCGDAEAKQRFSGRYTVTVGARCSFQ